MHLRALVQPTPSRRRTTPIASCCCCMSPCPCRLLPQHAPRSSGLRSSVSSCCGTRHELQSLHGLASACTLWQLAHAHRMPCCCCVSFCICCSASLVSSWKRMPVRCECFMNFSQHLCTHCATGCPLVSTAAAQRLLCFQCSISWCNCWANRQHTTTDTANATANTSICCWACQGTRHTPFLLPPPGLSAESYPRSP